MPPIPHAMHHGAREVHDSPGEYRILRRLAIAEDTTYDIRDAGLADSCPWLDGARGHHTATQAREFAVLKQVAFRVVGAAADLDGGDNIFAGDDATNLVGDSQGLLVLAWPQNARRHTFLVTVGAAQFVDVEIYFDVDAGVETSGEG